MRMVKLINIILFVLILCSGIISAQTEQDSASFLFSADTLKPNQIPDTVKTSDSSDSCRLTVISNPESAQVYIDTLFAGVTPLENHIIKKGAYKLKIINPKSLQDWQNDNRSFNIFINGDTTLNIRFRYFYFINSNPYSAKVFKGDSLLGETPLRFFTDNELTGSLLVRKKNYKEYSFDLGTYNFGTGANINLIPKGLEADKDLIYKDRITQFNTKRSLIPILGTAAVSIASCVLAFNYKNIANDEYDKYLLRGNSKYLEESQNNDTYFAVSLAVMQAAVAGLIYFLFFDK